MAFSKIGHDNIVYENLNNGSSTDIYHYIQLCGRCPKLNLHDIRSSEKRPMFTLNNKS